jgi:hypothetical protein
MEEILSGNWQPTQIPKCDPYKMSTVKKKVLFHDKTKVWPQSAMARVSKCQMVQKKTATLRNFNPLLTLGNAITTPQLTQQKFLYWFNSLPNYVTQHLSHYK